LSATSWGILLVGASPFLQKLKAAESPGEELFYFYPCYFLKIRCNHNPIFSLVGKDRSKQQNKLE